jgi:hypothetical protein
MAETWTPLAIGIESRPSGTKAWFRLYCFGCGHPFVWAAGHGETLPKNCPGCAKTGRETLDSRREGQHEPK